MKKTILSIAALAGLLFAGQSSAALMNESCFEGSDDDLTPSSACTYVYDDARTTLNDSESVLNTLELFGNQPWELFGKQEESGGDFVADGDDDFNLSVTATGGGDDPNEGTWSFDADAWNTFGSILLVMKDGNNAPSPPQSSSGGFYAYLLSATDSSGIWDTFDSFGGAGLSHMSAYGVRGSTQVPAPGMLGLMGVGLLAFSVACRSRRS